jgi:hypothetical protein
MQIKLVMTWTRINNNRIPKFCWITDQMDEDDLEDLCRDHETRPKQACQGLTGHRWGWWECLEENGRGWRDWGIGEIPEYYRCLWTPPPLPPPSQYLTPFSFMKLNYTSCVDRLYFILRKFFQLG